MEATYLSGYLEGLLNMASALSKSIRPSYIKVDCYEKKSFKKELCKFYDIKNIKLVESNETLESTLLCWLDDKELVDIFMYWFNIKTSGNEKVYITEERYKLDTKLDFYSLDDVIFVEKRKYIFVFLLGNNE